MNPRGRFPLAALGMALAVPVLAGGCSDVSVSVLPVLELELSPSEVTLLEMEETTVTVVLRGPGGEELTGRSITWESADPGVASVSGDGRIRGESPGATTVRASADDASASVSVTVVKGPTIGLPTHQVELRGREGQSDPEEETLPVANTGNGTLSGLTVSVSLEDEDVPQWLGATLSETSAPSDLRIRARFNGLEAGVYGGQVALSADGAMNSPQVVQVDFHVEERPPVVGLSPTSVGLTAVAGSHEAATQVVLVTNAGGGELVSLEATVEYPDDGPRGWLEAELEGPNAPTSLRLRALARNLGPGVHRAQVRVSSPVPDAGDGVVGVVFDVSTPPGYAGSRR
jgi:hypothetical protein